MNLERICEQVIEVARKAGAFAGRERLNFSVDVVKSKGLNNFVSYVDTTCEGMIVDALSTIIPSAGFIAEEGTGKPNPQGLNWVIDPLDGTTNYIHGLSPYAVSIALMENQNVLLGVIHEVSLNESFWAYEGGKASLNGSCIVVSETPLVKDSLIATGFPYHDYARMNPFFSTLDYFMRNSHGLRRLGSAATDMAYVACGRFDAFYEYGLNAWDVAAGVAIVQGAGGKVSDFSGGNSYIFGEEILAANNNVFSEIQQVIQNQMQL